MEEAGLKPQNSPDVSRLLRSSQFIPRCSDRLPPAPAPEQRPSYRTESTGAEMNADQILNEIREANLSYLMLAQNLIRTDREQALYRLGISEESAALIALLTPAQMMKIAAGNMLLCRFRMDDDMVWSLLTNHGKRPPTTRTDAPARHHPDGRPPPRGGLSMRDQEHPHRSQADQPRRRADPARRAPAGARVGDRPVVRAAAAPVQGSGRQVAEQGPAAVLDRLVHDLAAQHPCRRCS